ncbi:hypothetical protein IVB16_34820 [Bradyrhizobium sp. 183]|uniref:hypothetical protein n=1 Tax=unclassified Bradyrhizobium TaxID=2631580 RepID=UPI001FFE41D3|nr:MULTISPECIES: hypothetical protein [unclassified Bradyrhizobium]UPJ79758.1 hypothetical protein IVB17_34815 [Bradyrhizobium sp. 184]UPJ87553.1 hypothetical protein IVB16_34820 [Bradyrhizobium sp. 183]
MNRSKTLEASRHCFRIAHDAPGSIEEFLSLDSRSRAAIGTLEQRAAQVGAAPAATGRAGHAFDDER